MARVLLGRHNQMPQGESHEVSTRPIEAVANEIHQSDPSSQSLCVQWSPLVSSSILTHCWNSVTDQFICIDSWHTPVIDNMPQTGDALTTQEPVYSHLE